MYICQLHAGHWYICTETNYHLRKDYNKKLVLHPLCHGIYNTKAEAEAALRQAKLESK